MEPLTLLFICLGNSCRSIMAEAMARSLGGERVAASSAGLAPAGFVAEATLATLAERGHLTTDLRSKGLEAVAGQQFDVVVSLLGARGLDLLPPEIGNRREAWEIPDPFGEDPSVYGQVAARLELLVAGLLAEELGPELGGR
ncbi:MAG: hypothetical protein MUE90_11205 [Thermoanaerobaculales bacterium]|nr:hypothetical protein [Thermoanaerobaculales bacterium]